MGANVLSYVERRNTKDGPRFGAICLGLTASCCLFLMLNKMVKDVKPPPFIKPDVWSSWQFRNLFVSWIHAIIAGVWTILCLTDPGFFEDLVFKYNYFNYALVMFSTGYFIYDIIDVLVSQQISNNMEVLIHHLVAIAVFSLNLFTYTNVAYTVIALLHELNTIFLHLRKLLQFNGINFNSRLYRCNCYVNLITIVLFRFTSVAGIWYGIFMYREGFGVIHHIILPFSSFAMVPIDTILFWRLLKTDLLRQTEKKLDRASENLENNNKKSS